MATGGEHHGRGRPGGGGTTERIELASEDLPARSHRIATVRPSASSARQTVASNPFCRSTVAAGGNPRVVRIAAWGGTVTSAAYVGWTGAIDRVLAADGRALRAAYSRSLAADYRLPLLGATIDDALRDGVEAKEIWRAVCAEFEVPSHLR